MNPPARLFYDASTLIAAVGSKTGASAIILGLCRKGHCQLVSSRPVLLEAERNIKLKMKERALLHFYEAIASVELDLMATPTEAEIAVQHGIIDPKDAHVLAAALKGNVQALLTLDRKHFLIPSVLNAGFPFSTVTPGDFLLDWMKQSGGG